MQSIAKPSVDSSVLDSLGIELADSNSAILLPYTSLTVDEFEMIHEALPGLPERRLTIAVGGIRYDMGRTHPSVAWVALWAYSDHFLYPCLATALIAGNGDSRAASIDGEDTAIANPADLDAFGIRIVGLLNS